VGDGVASPDISVDRGEEGGVRWGWGGIVGGGETVGGYG
jgi:hypothetical protein